MGILPLINHGPSKIIELYLVELTLLSTTSDKNILWIIGLPVADVLTGSSWSPIIHTNPKTEVKLVLYSTDIQQAFAKNHLQM